MKISDYHRQIHRSWVELARRARQDGAAHAHYLRSAAATRFYFATLRRLGE